jgi:predicted transglutaminase-like protease
VAVLKLITRLWGSQPYLVDKKGEAVKISIENASPFTLCKTLFVALRLRFLINQFERFETLHFAFPARQICAQF